MVLLIVLAVSLNLYLENLKNKNHRNVACDFLMINCFQCLSTVEATPGPCPGCFNLQVLNFVFLKCSFCLIATNNPRVFVDKSAFATKYPSLFKSARFASFKLCCFVFKM